MADFSDPKYASYLDLCRELNVERPEFQSGDWHIHTEFWGEGPKIQGRNDAIQRSGIVYGSSPYRIWLPTLADWLEMIGEAGWWRGFKLDAMAGSDYRITATGSPAIGGPTGHEDLIYPHKQGTGPTYEEAAARLWTAVSDRSFAVDNSR